VAAVVVPAVVLVTNPVPVADLTVVIIPPGSAVYTNDLVVYGVNVTNLGPSSVTNAMLTNTLPAGVGFKGLSPSGLAYTNIGGKVVVNLGILTNQAFKNLKLTIQPTNAGVLPFLSVVATNGFLDPNPANNLASNNITVDSFIYDQLIATNFSAMTYDPQTGLMKQTIRLTNIGTNAVASARVIVSGLTNWLYNAVGTNNGLPYVVYGATLDTNQAVNLGLEYFVPTRLPITVANSNYTAVGTPVSNLVVPGGTNGTFDITLITNLPSGNILIEFQSVRGSNYTVLYSDNPSFSTPLAAQPSIVAQANRTQWIDDGPPKTVSSPTNTSSRFYRVLLND
jgi:uncharacterized repeat protein (TIGR01451 family)